MTPKLPVITSRKLIQALVRAGFSIDHQTGSHIFLSHPNNPAKIVPVPYHCKDLAKGTLQGILRLIGLSIDDLIEML
ncbi:MAG: type II toxin-antitoxin system HicA family toxin [Candidatus Komeilibacteria bacterium]|nr:type II toxin-antitoxin system HicA family toxin [Candidatus Komeilibacteria bacterium]